MADVQWIKLIVGMFDGNSFKRIKRAKIGGVSYRDKLTAVWFELLDLAGKSNANGYLMENEIPYRSFEDIATMLDREEKEIELCMQYFINERMVEIIDDVYCLSNFMKYQNHDGLEKIREQNRLRQAKYRKKQKLLASNVSGNVTVTESNGTEVDKELEKEKELDKDLFTTTTTAEAPTLSTVYLYFSELLEEGALKEAEKFHAYNANKGWTCLPNWKATADLWIARIEEKG
jgi:predicted phage replisome organizer